MKRFIALSLIMLLLILPGCGNDDIECSHDYEVVKTIESSCIKDGYTKYECEDCGHKYKVSIPKISHSYASGVCEYCGDIDPNYNVSQEEFQNTPVTITFYHQMGSFQQEILNSAISDFNRIYPNIKVIHRSYGDYAGVLDQIQTEITIGTQPNLAYCYPDHVALYNVVDVLQPLDELISGKYGYSQEELEDFIPAFYNEGKSFGDGKMYSLPIAKSTEVLYYNKTFFDENGLTAPTTWDEMEVVCKKIKELDPTCIPLGYDSESNWFITMCQQYGSEYTSIEGENFRFNNETNRNFIKRFRTWYENKWVTTEKLSGGYTSSLFIGDAGRCYMCISSTGGAIYQQPNQTNGEFEFEVGIATIPQVNPDKPKVISQGPSICLFKSDDTQEVLASWLFTKFLTTNVAFQASISMNNGYTPVIRSVIDNPIYADFLKSASTANIQAYAVSVALAQADAYFVSPAFVGSTVAKDQVGLLLQKCLLFEDNNVDNAIKKAFESAIAECKYQAVQ